MRLRHMPAIVLCAMATVACDEDTRGIGETLTQNIDDIVIAITNYGATTRSISVDSVYTANGELFLGAIRDPETGAIVESEFMAQFNMMEESHLPKESQMLCRDADGKVVADSCAIVLYYNKSQCYGDSTTALKIRVSELAKPVPDNVPHYTNFSPISLGYLREGGQKKDMMFTMTDYTVSDSLRRTGYNAPIVVRFQDEYTARDGKTYNNYGTYLLRTFYEHPEYFKNSYMFVNNVCPGFYFENLDGLGAMANFSMIELRAYYHYKVENDTTTRISYLTAAVTGEVLQTTNISNSREAIKTLVDDPTCTYLKSPAGIFTEVTLPVDEIKDKHIADSLMTVTISFNRMNNLEELKSYTFNPPQNVMLVQKDSLYTFFEKNRNYNNRYAFYTTLSKNAYTFASSSDISNLITLLFNLKEEGLKKDPDWLAKHPNWNKAVLLPVTPLYSNNSTTTTTYYSGTASTTIVGMENELNLRSTRLIRGTEDNPLTVQVVYGRFGD